MLNELRPNKAEVEFLTLAYNRFLDIFNEIFLEEFFAKDNWYRYSKIKDGFAVYSEVLNYEPIKWVIESLNKVRPPGEAEIAKDLFKFIRNVVFHLPFFESWNEVWIKKSIVNWYKQDQSINNFLERYKGKEVIKYRFWEEDKKRMTYLSINFPKDFNEDTTIYLRDILSEQEGVKFSFIMMRKILVTQIESIEEK